MVMMVQEPHSAVAPDALQSIQSPRSWREKLTMRRFQSGRRFSNDDSALRNNYNIDDSIKDRPRSETGSSRGVPYDARSRSPSVERISRSPSRDSLHQQQQHQQHPNPTMTKSPRQGSRRRGKRSSRKRHTIDSTLSDIHPTHYNANNEILVSPREKGGGGAYGRNKPPTSPRSDKRQLSGLLTRFLSSKRSLKGDGSSGDTCTRMTDDEADIVRTGSDTNGNHGIATSPERSSNALVTTAPRPIPASSMSSLRSSTRNTGTPASTTSLSSLPSFRFRRSTMDSMKSSGGGAGAASFAASSSGSIAEVGEELPPAPKRSMLPLVKTASSVLANGRSMLQKQTSMVLSRLTANDSMALSSHGTLSIGGSVRRGSNGAGTSMRRGSNGSGSVLLFGSSANSTTAEELPYELKQAELQNRAEDLHKGGRLDEAIELWAKSLYLAEENRVSLSSRTEISCTLMDLHFQLSVQRKREEQDRSRTFGSSCGSIEASRSSLYDGDDEEEKATEAANLDDNYLRMGYGDPNAPIPLAVTASMAPRTAKRRSSSSVSLGLDIDTVEIPGFSFHCVSRENSGYHRTAAKRYAHDLKPALVKASWIGCSIQLMEFLSESEAWELALVVAEKLTQESAYTGRAQVGPQQLATLHFRVASQKLDLQRQGEALQHLQATVKNLRQVPDSERDMVMFLQVLQLLATEYQTQGQPALALETYAEQLKHAPIERQAQICCQMAEIYISERQLEMALVELEQAAEKLSEMGSSEGTGNAQSTIRLQLLQTKGDVYYRLGRTDESMLVYQQALNEAKHPAEKAKLFYTMGRLCIRLRRTRDAITCFSRELEITQQELGMNHMSVSRIYHELAKLYDEGLGEQKMALMKYNKALQIELAVLQDCQFGVAACQMCNPVAHRMCDMHANMHTLVMNQIRDTKRCQGRMHFKLGDFDKALKTSLMDQQSSGVGSRRSGRRFSGPM